MKNIIAEKASTTRNTFSQSMQLIFSVVGYGRIIEDFMWLKQNG